MCARLIGQLVDGLVELLFGFDSLIARVDLAGSSAHTVRIVPGCTVSSRTVASRTVTVQIRGDVRRYASVVQRLDRPEIVAVTVDHNRIA